MAFESGSEPLSKGSGIGVSKDAVTMGLSRSGVSTLALETSTECRDNLRIIAMGCRLDSAARAARAKCWVIWGSRMENGREDRGSEEEKESLKEAATKRSKASAFTREEHIISREAKKTLSPYLCLIDLYIFHFLKKVYNPVVV